MTAPKSAEQPARTAPAVAVRPRARAPKQLAALPPAAETPRATPVAPERKITVIRGGRQPASTRSPDPEKRRLAALPTHAQTATDAPPILVLRGSRNRYALASGARPQPTAMPLLHVIRGARPRPIILHHYVQPSALILRIRD